MATQEPSGRWCLVSGPAYYGALPQELERNDGRVTWSAPGRMVVGDLALLYESSPSKAFRWLFRARSDPVPDPSWGHMAWFEAIEFKRGLGFAEAAADAVISQWPKMKAHLVGSNHVVPRSVWDRIIELLVSRNPETEAIVDAWSAEIPKAEARSLDDFIPADIYEGEPLFKREAEMEAFVRDFFITEGIARLPAPDDGLALRGQQDRLDPTARADLLMVAEESEIPTLGIVECKLWAGSVANVAQIQRYADLLDELLPEGRGLTGHLVAEGFSDAVVQAAKDAGIACWQFFEDEHGELFVHPIVSPNEPQADERPE